MNNGTKEAELLELYDGLQNQFDNFMRTAHGYLLKDHIPLFDRMTNVIVICNEIDERFHLLKAHLQSVKILAEEETLRLLKEKNDAEEAGRLLLEKGLPGIMFKPSTLTKSPEHDNRK